MKNKNIEIVVFNDKSWVRLTEYQKVKEQNEQLKARLEKLIDFTSHYINECDVCELWKDCKVNDWCCPAQTKDIKELIREYVSRS